MKQLFIIFNIVAVLFTSQAQAHLSVEESPVSYSARLLTFDINHDFIRGIDSGMVRVNETNEMITLILHRPWSCPEGMACATVMPEPEVIELPIVNVYTDWCGSTTYEASVDKTPVDGLRETLKVTDYSTLECRILVPYQTTIEYTSFNPWVGESTTSRFDAEALSLDAVLF